MALARRLAGILYAMMRDGTDHGPTDVSTAGQADYGCSRIITGQPHQQRVKAGNGFYRSSSAS